MRRILSECLQRKDVEAVPQMCMLSNSRGQHEDKDGGKKNDENERNEHLNGHLKREARIVFE